MTPLVERDHYLYRVYSREGLLLYIGLTVNLEQRMYAHKISKGWHALAQQVCVEGPYPGRAAGLKAETEAIHAEEPLFALSAFQVGQLGAKATHKVGCDGRTALTRYWANVRHFRQFQAAA